MNKQYEEIKETKRDVHSCIAVFRVLLDRPCAMKELEVILGNRFSVTRIRTATKELRAIDVAETTTFSKDMLTTVDGSMVLRLTEDARRAPENLTEEYINEANPVQRAAGEIQTAILAGPKAEAAKAKQDHLDRYLPPLKQKWLLLA